MKEPPRKIFAEAQVFKRDKLSRVQGFKVHCFLPADTPMLSLRLSSFQLLTFKPLESKLPTLTRLPSESRYCSFPSRSPRL